MKVSEIRSMKTEEVHAELDRLRRHLFDLRSQAVTEKLENPHRLQQARADIARALTILRERGETCIEAKQYHLETVTSRQRGG